MSLDSRLRDIDLFISTVVDKNRPGIDGVIVTQRLNLQDAAIERIKQAFVDAGYVPTWGQLIAESQKMSGQKWYDRFDKELKALYQDNLADDGYYLAQHAAKRAAGLA
jgi:hypothetical protein